MNTYSIRKNKSNNNLAALNNEYQEIIEIDINDDMVDYINVASYNMEQIPNNVSISTMSLSCYLGTLFIPDNIYKYRNYLLDDNSIIAIKSKKGLACLDKYKDKFKSTNKNSKKNFYNQLTVIVKVYDEKFINVKLFKNGSIQMTGCKLLSDANIVVNKLINKLKETLFIEKKPEIGNLTAESTTSEIKFVENPENLSVSKFKIDLINSNFGVNYLVNRESLYKLLTEKNVLCRISSIHACVNIKFKVQTPDNTDSYVSIFVFQTGNIIITGAKKAEHVKDAYYYIVSVLSQNKQKIMKKDITSLLSPEELEELLNS
jgi:TATA-box binding protein (TBP) (component of TFIID and TFIIIB)